MSPRLRVSLAVAAAAAAAAGVTVGATILTSSGSTDGAAPSGAARPRPGAPPLLLDLGVRVDPQARALRHAAVLYDRGQRRKAKRIFDRYDSPEAQVGAALADWPAGWPRLERLARARPASALTQLHLGLGLYWRGGEEAARAAWRRAGLAQPDTSYAVRAADLLHPQYIPGLPFFVPSFPSPPALAKLTPPRQFAFLARRARDGNARDKILYGVALQRLGRPISAERQFAAAQALQPSDPEARVAAAVGLFDKDKPEVAFSRLGPLTRTFPGAPTVRFHLGLLSLWLGQTEEAERQLRLVEEEAPWSGLAREAKRLLARLESVGRSGETP